MRLERLAQGARRRLPAFVAADELVGVLRRQVERELVEAERPQHRQDEVEQRGDLGRRLFRGAEDVAVVLGEAADAHQAVQRPGSLVAVHRAELEHPQRQLAVAALARLEDQAVHRAVHRLHVVRCRCPSPSAGTSRRRTTSGGPTVSNSFPLREVRREHELVATRLVAHPAVVLDHLAHDGALRVPDTPVRRRARAGSSTGRARWRACGGRASPPRRAGRDAPAAPPLTPRPCRRCAAASGRFSLPRQYAPATFCSLK